MVVSSEVASPHRHSLGVLVGGRRPVQVLSFEMSFPGWCPDIGANRAPSDCNSRATSGPTESLRNCGAVVQVTAHVPCKLFFPFCVTFCFPFLSKSGKLMLIEQREGI